jgi:hypothetical protein
MTTASGFVLPLQPPRWLVAEPDDWPRRRQANHPLTWGERAEEVYRGRLSVGIDVIGQRAGVLKFDFGGYPEALSPSGQDAGQVPWDHLVRAQAARLRAMNAWALCLHVTYLTEEKMDVGAFRLTPSDLFHYNDEVGGMGGPGIATLDYPGGPQEWSRSWVIPKGVLDGATEALDSAFLTQDGSLVDLLVLLNEALNAYKEHDAPLAVVAAWTVCEVLIDKRWSEFFEGAKDMTRRRREKLRGRDYSAAVVTEVLNLNGRLPDDLYERLNDVRRGRNNWVHSMEPPHMNTARDALVSAAELVGQVWGRPAEVGLGLSISGI